MPLDHYVTLGRSGLRVSPLCLGAMTFGEDLGWGSSVEESQRIIDRFIDLGGNFIDTANFYTKGHSEKIIGDHVGRHPRPPGPSRHRDQVQRQPLPGDPNGGGSGRKSIVAACEQSLRRLQTDYIDLYWLHNWDVHTPIEETMAALEDLVRAGQGPLPRRLRHARVEDRRGERDRSLPRLVGLHRAPDRVLPPRAHRRAGTRADGPRVRTRHHAVVAAQERRAQRQVHATRTRAR